MAECDCGPDFVAARVERQELTRSLWCVQDVSLGGWRLYQMVGSDEIKYKFHRSVMLQAHHYLTVSNSASN